MKKDISAIEEAYLKVIPLHLSDLIIAGRRKINDYPLSLQERTLAPPSFPMKSITPERIYHLLSKYLILEEKVGLYIHLPFCNYSCTFCNYTRLISPPRSAVDKYLDAVKKEMDLLLKISGRKSLPVNSIYFGGGTPTYLSAKQIKNLLNSLFGRLSITSDIEISFEASPETIDERKIDILLKGGVNRLSIGIEAFEDHLLEAMEREHDVTTAISAFKLARRGGFKNINIDLLYGLPGQTLQDWQHSLEEAIALSADTIYTYRILPGYGSKMYSTHFFSNIIVNASALTESLVMGALAIDKLRKAGYILRSLYRFILPDKYPFHQKFHMNEVTDKISLGVSGRSYLKELAYINYRRVKDYMDFIGEDRLPISKVRRCNNQDKIALTISLLSERMHFNKEIFKNKIGVSIEEIFVRDLNRL